MIITQSLVISLHIARQDYKTLYKGVKITEKKRITKKILCGETSFLITHKGLHMEKHSAAISKIEPHFRLI